LVGGSALGGGCAGCRWVITVMGGYRGV
jgi:hypothetical protein